MLPSIGRAQRACARGSETQDLVRRRSPEHADLLEPGDRPDLLFRPLPCARGRFLAGGLLAGPDLLAAPRPLGAQNLELNVQGYNPVGVEANVLQSYARPF